MLFQFISENWVWMLRLARERWELIENVAKPTKVSIFFSRTLSLLMNCLVYSSVKLLIVA